MNILYISILESLYLIFMFRFFKTSVNFDILKIYWDNKYLNHNVENVYGPKICPFGQDIIFVLIFILLIRNIFSFNQTYIYYSLYIVLGLSLLMNWNAFVYIIPVLLVEKYFNNA